MKLQIADNLALPIKAVTEKMAMLGRTGSGKTYAAMKLAELMLDAGAQIVAMDPVGAWSGLRIGGHWNVYIFGGLRGDFPLEPTGGKLMADLIADRGICAVLDVSQFIRSDQVRFASDFIERFFNRKKAAPSAVHLFLEECQEFAPQNSGPSEAHMLHHFERMWKLGRGFGIGGTLLSQRPQEVNKKVLNQSGTLFVFQMTGPQERKAIGDWTNEHGITDDIQSLLPRLKVGEPHVWSPTFLETSKTVRILPKITTDVSSTPEVGARIKERPLSSIDVETLKSDMAATVERSKADDPRELRKQIAALNKEIVALKQQQPKTETKEVPVITDHDKQLLSSSVQSIQESVNKCYDSVRAWFSGTQAAINDISEIVKGVGATVRWRPAPEVPFDYRKPVRETQQRVVVHKTPAVLHKTVRPAHDSELGKCEIAILRVLAQFPEGCEAGKLALLAGYRFSGGFRNALSTLRQAGLMEGANSEVMRITAAGEARGPFEPLPVGQELQSYWLNHASFGLCEKKILEKLFENPQGLTAQQLCKLTGYEFSGGFRNSLSTLRTAGVLVGRNGDVMRASDELFD